MPTIGSMLKLASIKSLDQLPHILWIKMDGARYFHLLKYILKTRNEDISDKLGLSSSLMYRYPDRVLASTIKGSDSIFKIFESFDDNIYLATIASSLAMSLLVAISHRSIKTFFSYLWSYLSVILSDYYALKIESRIDRLLTGVWLMSCTVLLAAFSGVLRELMIRAKPIYWIDTWEDLSKWKHLRIDTFKATGLANYLDNFKHEPLAIELNKTINYLDYDLFKDGRKSYDKDLDYQGFKNGHAAFVDDYNYVEFFKRNLISGYGLVEDIDIHISESDDLASLPVFAVVNKERFNQIWLFKLNLM